jgi:hypothetical protein
MELISMIVKRMLMICQKIVKVCIIHGLPPIGEGKGEKVIVYNLPHCETVQC